ASGSQSPITMGWNFGTHWLDVPFSHYYYPVKAVASHGPTNYQTPYSGDFYSQRKPYAFFGSDSFYTLGGRVGGFISQEFATATNSGAMGICGLDMTAFLFTDSDVRRRQKALWAVKSHLNNANTEIWQWPASPNGPFVFTKIATITGKIFNVLYTDGNSDSTPHRTIWAGANGEIWVSYNSGLTWAVATTAPNGNIYSFVRASSGVLIAGGANGEIFLFGGSGSEGGGSGGENNEDPPTEPENPVPGIATSRFLGRTATCEDEVYTANKFAFSNVTHIFHYNGSSYSNLQFANLPPYNLFGTAAAINKAAYFGSKTNDSNVPGGPFSSLVFDITTEARNITIVWEYWDGSSWTTLTTQDNTSGFQQLGVNSVNWEIPSNWTTTTVNSITGYWVRARISAVSSNSQTPIQDNRYIYTTRRPYIEVAASQISGDLPAIGRIFWRNQGKPTLERLICGLRSLSRGSNFNAYINISDTQTPFGLTITKSSTSG